jgi:transcriptional regulator with XRE-family HTH domain
MKNANLKKFGEILKDLRMKKNLSLRDICKKVNYDPSNWSKIERGLISPPSDKETLSQWANTLGIKNGSAEYYNFIDLANIAQSIIPDYIMQEADLVKALPAFFRTVRNEKPTKKEIDDLINLIKNN